MSTSEISEKLHKLSDEELHLVYLRTPSNNYENEDNKKFDFNVRLEKIDAILKSIKRSSPGRQASFWDITEKLLAESAFNKELLNWISKDEAHICIFSWLYISNMQEGEIKKSRFALVHSDYNKLLLPRSPSCADECYKLIHSFFYLWNVSESTKINLLNLMKASYQNARGFKHKMLNHLKKFSEAESEWLMGYMNTHYGLSGPMPDTGLFHTFKEKNILLFAYLDLCINNVDNKIIYLNRVYSAYHAKKFKEKPKNLKGANFWLGPEQIRMLNEIAWRKKLSDKDALYSLVNDAYLKIIK